MVGRLRNLFRTRTARSAHSEHRFAFSRPLVLLQSDDWGRVGVRDREGYDLLRSRGVRLGEHPYDLYTLETSDDVNAIFALLERHRDSSGRHACMAMNFCSANLDFERMRNEGNGTVRFLPLARGLPGKWSRPALVDAYRGGIESRVFDPALHGVSHFCRIAVEDALARPGERQKLLLLLWEAETPYIHWRMPWVGFEYWDPERPRAEFLSYEQQKPLIEQAVRNFSDLFQTEPTSVCAPGYRANGDTHRAWSEAGIRVAQSGTGSGLQAPYLDEHGILHTFRTIDFEPSQREVEIGKHLDIARVCFAKGLPFIISVHAINFHSTLKDFRTPTLAALDALLTALEVNHPDLLYVNDEELYEVAISGKLGSRGEQAEIVSQPAKQLMSASGNA